MKLKGTGTRVVAALGVLATVIGIYAFVQTATAARYRCWDGSLGTTISDCPAPKGKWGLPWFFPSLESATHCPFTRPVKTQKVAVYVCDFRTAGRRGLIRYTAWTDPESAKSYYNEQYSREPTVQALDEQGVGYEWTTEGYSSPRGLRFKESGSFYDAPFSWSVEASSQSALTLGRRLLKIREIDHWVVDRKLNFWERLKNGMSF